MLTAQQEEERDIICDIICDIIWECDIIWRMLTAQQQEGARRRRLFCFVFVFKKNLIYFFILKNAHCSEQGERGVGGYS